MDSKYERKSLVVRLFTIIFFLFFMFYNGVIPSYTGVIPSYTVLEIEDNIKNNFVNAALERTKHNITYDGRYYNIEYPNGDIPESIGVCTDVIIMTITDEEGSETVITIPIGTGGF